MAYWLVKSEPDTWSWDAQKKKGAKGDAWTGVRNHQAKVHLMAMKKGDLAFFYHSGDEKAVVGIVEVLKPAYPDPTDKEGKFVCVDVRAGEPMKTPVTLRAIKADAALRAIKADAALKDMVLVKNSRLSVQPVTAAEWKKVCAMGGVRE